LDPSAGTQYTRRWQPGSTPVWFDETVEVTARFVQLPAARLVETSPPSITPTSLVRTTASKESQPLVTPPAGRAGMAQA